MSQEILANLGVLFMGLLGSGAIIGIIMVVAAFIEWKFFVDTELASLKEFANRKPRTNGGDK